MTATTMCVLHTVAALALCILAASGSHDNTGYSHSLRTRQTAKSNVLVIMTDDQDLLLDSMSVMPNVKNLIGGNGVTYNKHYCQNAICCPSRATFWTGKASHNHGLTDNRPPFGAWPKFVSQGLNNNWLPVWFSNAGINTYYVGKVLNGYGVSDLSFEPAKGWTNSSFLVDPYTYNYLDSEWTNNADASSPADVTKYSNIHTTDVTNKKALDMIDEAAADGNQFFMMVAGVAPHVQSGQGTGYVMPIPAKYANTFTGRQAPRGTNFNPERPSGASWVSKLPLLTSRQLTIADEIYASRLANLAYVDDMVGNLVKKLSQKGLLDNTYVVFTTDNGFHIGNHRLPPGKRCPYEEDINIPLYIRGPDVAQGVTTDNVNSMTDMAPTIFQMLGVTPQSSYAFDGSAIPYTSAQLGNATYNELVQVEGWTGTGNPELIPRGEYFNNTYKALRLITNGNDFYYSVWCTGEKEFYDMTTDQAQMQNRLASPPRGIPAKYYGQGEEQLFARLDALLMVAKDCQTDTCRNPWGVLFPDGQVNNLESAMATKYDSFFANQRKVTFTSCELGLDIIAEGPRNIKPYS